MVYIANYRLPAIKLKPKLIVNKIKIWRIIARDGQASTFDQLRLKGKACGYRKKT